MGLPATEQAPFKDATRILSSVLATAEKTLLIAIARRLPPWLSSDHLTLLGLLAMPAAGLAFALIPVAPWAAAWFVVALALNWFGDSLDGTLARVRQHQRPRYGYYVDHVVDAAGAICLFGGLALSGYMHPLVAMGLLVAYLVMSVEIYLAAHVLGEFRITYFQMGPTELRILLAVGSLWLMVKPLVTLFGHTYRLFDVGGIAGIVGLGFTVLITVIRHTRTLYKLEPIPK